MSSEAELLQQQLNEMRKMMDEFNQTLAPLKTQSEQLDNQEKAAYQEYQDRVAAIRKVKQEIDNKMFEARKKANELDRNARQLQYKLEEARKREERERKNAELKEQFAVLQDKWDLMTAGAPWREWAKDHQIAAGHKITGDRKVILADPMGLGKTLSAIITCDMAEAATREASVDQPFLGELKDVYVNKKWNPETEEWEGGYYEPQIVGGVTRPAGKKILYFCPSPMIRNVEREFRMWAKHRNVTFIGGMTKSERKFVFDFVLKARPEYVVICNYEAWRKDMSLIDSLIEADFDTVIIDEAHNIKDIKSIAYRGVKRLIDELDPPYIIPMTGTPILNRPQELFALLTLVNPERFHTLNDFLWNYCEQDRDTGFWKFKPGGLDRIAKAIGKNFLRRTKDQAGIDLPEKTITVHALQVDAEAYPMQAKVREQMRKHAMIMLDENSNKAVMAAAMIAVFTRLRQIETWPAGIEVKDPLTKEVRLKVDVEESQKVDYIIKFNPETKEFDGLIPEVIEDERIVLFSQFKAPLREIKDRIERMGKRAVILDGDTPTHVKDQIMLDFDNRHTPDRANTKWDIVLCNYRVGGVGMNLTAATQMIILDEEWNPGKRDQAYDRIHRMGQDKPVTIHVIRNEKTIDDWLAGIMEQKEGLVDGFNNTMISAADFKDALDSGLI